MADSRYAGVRNAVETGPLGLWQIVTLVLCILINISDGLDTSAVAYAAPSLLREWGMGTHLMGLVFSAGAAGLVCGAIFIAPQADRVGRRTIIIGAVTANGLAMLGTAFISSVEMLLFLRFITGLGVGALVPSLSVMVVEFSNEKRGNLALALVHIGFAIGAMLGGAVGAVMIGPYGWQSIFIFAGMVSLVLAVISYVLLPESLNFLLSRQPRNALARANALLAKLGQPQLDALPPKENQAKGRSGLLRTILAPEYRTATLLLWLAAFSRYFVSYFLTQWKPQILVLAGITPEMAIASGIVTGGAAIFGSLMMGTFAGAVGARRATCVSFMLCGASLVAFAFVEASPVALLACAALAIFAIEATFTGIVITSTRFYPPEFRTTGVGFTIGVGRFGAIAGPYMGGALLAMNLDRSFVYPVYAAACLVGAAAIMIGFTRRTPKAG